MLAERRADLVHPPLPCKTARSDERFAAGYSPARRPAHEARPDLNRLTWLRKRCARPRPFHIVCPSQWLADCVRRSSIDGRLANHGDPQSDRPDCLGPL